MARDLLDDWNDYAARGRARIRDARGDATTAAVDAQAGALADALLAGRASLEGERIAILAAPGARFVAALFGVWKAHGTAVVLLPEHPDDEHRYALTDAGARTLLVSDEHAKAAATSLARPIAIEDVAPPMPHASRAFAGAPDDAPALMLYTSGTTSKPKGAVLSRRNIAVQATLLRDAWGVTPEDTLLHALPLHHMHGLAIALVNALFAGASVTMLKFASHDVWRAMGDATMFMAVPTMYAKLFAALDEAPAEQRAEYIRYAAALRLATSGSAALPVTLGERFRAVSGQFPLERFGMTEIGVGLTNPLRGERRPGYVGFPLPTVETRIVGEDGRDAN
jgi:malonyl-CoA/methylmalonyl-CoA synthetase